MKTGYSFGSLVSFVEVLNTAAVKITGDQTIAGLKTFSSNPITSAAQGSGGGYLTRKDYVDGALALKAPLASPTLTGTPTAPTAAADTNTTQIATTAFVTSANTAQLATANPLMDGTVAVGTSTLLSRQDHRHPTDTSRAPLASPALTGTPTAPTAAGGTNTTQIATTAFVQSTAASIVTAKASSTTPLMDGTATAGTSTNYAREGHIHPTDTSRAPLASPALTGVPTAPTAEVGTNTTQIATTAFVQSAAAASGLSFRNKIVDGRFDFWYEKTSQTTNGYGSDTMWQNENIGSTKTHTRQALNPDADLPAIHVPSAKYFSRTVVSSVAGVSNYVAKITKIENVRTLAGKKATLSFYAKADAAKNIAIELSQRFGTGGTPSNDVVGIGSQLVPLSSSWTRYSIQIDVPSINGKALGTNADDCLVLAFWFDAGSTVLDRVAGLGNQSGTFDIACVQLEEGEQATKFEELPMPVAESLVGRYYETSYQLGIDVGTASSAPGARGVTHPKNTSQVYNAATQFKYEKRRKPSVSLFSTGSGEIGNVFNVTTITSERANASSVSPRGFLFLFLVYAPTTVNNDFAFHYVADARL